MILSRRVVLITGAAFMAQPAMAAGYRNYAINLLNHFPKGAKLRPDLEMLLNQLANQARLAKSKPGLQASPLLTDAARAQALEMLKGNFVGHQSASGYRFRDRFMSMSGLEPSAFGENAARDRQPGHVDTIKARRLFQQWITSRGHRFNLYKLDYQFVSTGAIEAGHHLYAVQMFWGL